MQQDLVIDAGEEFADVALEYQLISNDLRNAFSTFGKSRSMQKILS